MGNRDYIDPFRCIIYEIENSVVPNSQSITLSAFKLSCTYWARVVFKRDKFRYDLIMDSFWKMDQLLFSRTFKED